MRRLPIALALLFFGCGSTTSRSTTTLASWRSPCGADQHWNGSECVARDGLDDLDKGATALAGFQVDEALPLLDSARQRGPYRHTEYVKLYEQLGIAHAYLGHEEQAISAFDMLLGLDPGHLLSYTLSPKATFLFERVRRQAETQPAPALQLSWPRELSVDRPVPLEVEVIADPHGFLDRAALHLRVKGSPDYKVIDLELPAAGGYRQLDLPPIAGQKPETLQLYLTAFDDRGNEVLRWASPDQPREIGLDYQPPVRWYRNWWVWAIGGTAVALATGTTVYLLGRDPPDTIDGIVDIIR